VHECFEASLRRSSVSDGSGCGRPCRRWRVSQPPSERFLDAPSWRRVERLRALSRRLKKIASRTTALSQDDEKKGARGVQKLTDLNIKAIDDLQKKKDTELLDGSNSQLSLSGLNSQA